MSNWTHVNFVAEVLTDSYNSRTALKEQIEEEIGVPFSEFITGSEENAEEIADWISDNWEELEVEWDNDVDGDEVFIITKPDGNEMFCPKNGWLVKSIDDSIYPVKDETFKKVYELVDDSTKVVTW